LGRASCSQLVVDEWFQDFEHVLANLLDFLVDELEVFFG
jgi:hypothetical protein